MRPHWVFFARPLFVAVAVDSRPHRHRGRLPVHSRLGHRRPVGAGRHSRAVARRSPLPLAELPPGADDHPHRRPAGGIREEHHADPPAADHRDLPVAETVGARDLDRTPAHRCAGRGRRGGARVRPQAGDRAAGDQRADQRAHRRGPRRAGSPGAARQPARRWSPPEPERCGRHTRRSGSPSWPPRETRGRLHAPAGAAGPPHRGPARRLRQRARRRSRRSSPAGAARPAPAEIRDRLIELDDLRQRKIISEEEFAAKKAELLSRI